MSSPTGTCGAAFSRSLLLFVIAVLAGPSSVRTSYAQLSAGGEYEYYGALGLERQLQPYAIRSRLRLRGRYERRGMMAYSAVRVSSALSDPEKGGDPGPVRLRITEAFLDLYFDRVDVRIGHQLIVWGQMDGVFITDVVSPLDLTEFLAQDMTDIRLAVPAVKASYYGGPWSVTGLLVVVPVKSLIPSTRSPWFVVPDEAGSPEVLVGNDNLANPGPEEVEPGAKVTYGGTSTTMDFIYLYGRNRIPAFAKAVDFVPDGATRLMLRPDYTRRHVLGSRLSTTLADPFVVEAEVAYESRIEVDVDPSILLAGSPGTHGLLLSQGHLDGGLSLSRTYRSTLLRAQFLGSLLTRYDDRVARDRFHEAVTVLIRSAWSNDTFAGTVFAYYSPGGDYWLNPVLQYNAAQGLNLFIGAHVFGGDAMEGNLSTAAFGLFDGNDLAYIRLTLAF